MSKYRNEWIDFFPFRLNWPTDTKQIKNQLYSHKHLYTHIYIHHNNFQLWSSESEHIFKQSVKLSMFNLFCKYSIFGIFNKMIHCTHFYNTINRFVFFFSVGGSIGGQEWKHFDIIIFPEFYFSGYWLKHNVPVHDWEYHSMSIHFNSYS